MGFLFLPEDEGDEFWRLLDQRTAYQERPTQSQGENSEEISPHFDGFTLRLATIAISLVSRIMSIYDAEGR